MKITIKHRAVGCPGERPASRDAWAVHVAQSGNLFGHDHSLRLLGRVWAVLHGHKE